MNELSATDKALIVNALLRLVGEDVLTVLEKRDILHEITAKLTSFNIADIVSETNNRRRLLLKNIESDQGYTGLPRELVFDPATKTIKIFGPTSADDTTIGAAPDIDVEELLEDIDYVIESGSNSVGWYRKWKSGWVEQGGTSTGTGTSTPREITLPVVMSNTSYTITTSIQDSTISTTVPAIRINSRTTTYIRFLGTYQSGSTGNYLGASFNWRAEGMAAN